MNLKHLACFVVLATTITVGIKPLCAQINLSDSQPNNGFLNTLKPKLSVSLSTSSSFGYGYNALNTFIMPKVSFPITDKFSVSAGIGYSTLLMGYNGKNMFSSQSSNYGHVFVSGNYLLYEKITLSGTVYKTVNLNPTPPGSESMSSPYGFTSHGVIMDAEYKVTDNFRINIGFEYRKQNYPVCSPGMYPGTSIMDFNRQHEHRLHTY